MSILEFPSFVRRTDFRLERFEIYNWGTFDGRVWAIDPRGESALVTGDIGSGKSTVVDAITTLLVAPQKIAYNRAAGAEARERSLRSYVAGHYKSERGEAGHAAKAVALRDRTAYTVILGRFTAAESDLDITLAQVFWQREAQGQPERLYVIADRALSIGEHFGSFGGDLRELRRRLRELGAEVHDSFAAYGAAYRRRLGIDDERAMDLFHQTISMKSVGNLTDFVREHMLEPFAVEERIAALVAHFDDLTRAHDAVLVAKAQIALLGPLASDAEERTRVVERAEHLRSCREALRPWFAHLKAGLLDKRLAGLDAEHERRERRIEGVTAQKLAAAAECDSLRDAIARNGGDRLDGLRREIDRLTADRAERARRAERYDTLAQTIGLPAATDEERFVANTAALVRERDALDREEGTTQEAFTEAALEDRTLRDAAAELERELTSLRARRTNIPRAMLDLRARVAHAIGCDDDALPFVGELVGVRPEASDWEGAAERLLHNFALSLVVPDAVYGDVAEWVDRTHLGGRLVYYRVRANAGGESRPGQVLDPLSLVRKLALAPDTPFAPWLTSELERRFDYICCDTMDRFRREPKAVTRAGQTKAGGERHEKDDRRNIADRSNYVLGWSNVAKISALEEQLHALSARIAAASARREAIAARRRTVQERLGIIAQLSGFERFTEIDWRPIAVAIADLERERAELQAASDVLRTLEEHLAKSKAALATAEHALLQFTREQAQTDEKRTQAALLLDECVVVLDATPIEAQERYFPELETMRAEALGSQILTVESCENRERDMRDWLQARKDAEDHRADRLGQAVVRAMQEYRGRYPADAQELDAALDAAPAYVALLERLRADDLPRFESRFKELLNENAIREVANFQSQLNRELRTTQERIEHINASLHAIDYNPGRYIVLEAERSLDPEIRDFQRDLRACTEGTLTGSDEHAYAEAKFLQVRHIVERFRGREGTTELDRRWTRKVTDVRNWQTFAASERWREDDREHEHYTDTGGKSGGQKEKLAYTVLAASLAYQFGFERRSGRSFRFVAIDEAFGRGSDESARYGLQLFKELGLQLLVVTPLQKIHVIEPFVANVAFVHNDGRASQIRNLTIEEFRAERQVRIG
jgi:uncharacterized protein YPO0396